MPLIVCFHEGCRNSLKYEKGLTWQELVTFLYTSDWRILRLQGIADKAGFWYCPKHVASKASYQYEETLEWLVENELRYFGAYF